MSAVVPHRRPEPAVSPIEVGAPVSGGQTWVPIGGMANWINGHGGMLIPWCAVAYPAEAGLTYTLSFQVSTKPQATERVWRIFARADGSAGSASCDFTVGSLATQTVLVSEGRAQDALVFREPLSASASGLEVVEVVIAPASGGSNITIDGIACYEQTRAELRQDTTDYGVDLSTLAARQPILASPYQSMQGVAAGLQSLQAKRAGYFHAAIPKEDPLVVTDGASELVYPFPIPLIGAVAARGDTTAFLTVAAYMGVTALTGDGRLIVESANAGDVLTLTTNSGLDWVTGEIEVEAEDLTDPDGLPAAGMEYLTFTLEADSGETCELAGISVIRDGAPI